MELVSPGPVALPATAAPARAVLPRAHRRVLAALALLVVWIAALTLLHRSGHNAAPLLRDPATMAGLPVWHGALSTLGCMAWALTAGLCLAAHIGRPDHATRTWALLAGLTAVLGVDDALMLHEETLPALGVAQELTFLAYAIVAVLIARDIHARPADFDVPLLGVACAGLALSVGLDVVVQDALVIYEDGPKAFGIVVLAVWAYGRARAAMGAPRTTAG